MAAQAQNDDKILKLMNEVKKRKLEIATSEKAAWSTNCSLNIDGKVFNLHVVNDINVLVGAMAHLLNKRANYNEAAKLLGFDKVTPFKHDGYSLEDWLSDMKIRATKIQITQKRKDLEKYEAQLDKLLSADKRVELELDQLEKELLS